MSQVLQVTITIDPISKQSRINTNSPALAKDLARLHGIFLDAARACMQQAAGPPEPAPKIIVPTIRVGNGHG